MSSSNTTSAGAADAPGGRAAPIVAAPEAPTVAAPVLRLRDIGWTVGGATIVDSVSFDVRPGEFLAFIGPNGAGKTSLFNLISGIGPVSRGAIELDGRDVTTEAAYARARRGLGRTFQTSSLWPGMTVADHVRLAAQAAEGRSYRVWRRAGTYPELVDRVLARTQLAHRAESCAEALSHGEKRKLELAVLLVGEPRLMLLDEPMAGVSAEEVPALTALIRSLHKEEGRTVLMVEHHMDVLLELADRVAVMHHGTLLALDTPQAVMADPTVQQAYLGEGL
ncbi:ABC transporter ATP-binding protein [Streptomyces sp. NPDC052192]|uniref:ABC transporter ATP-binding protein n=1 Tax=Streptomyces sp. NPDC052192 TaxID=3155052 RepID=UPI003435D1AC